LVIFGRYNNELAYPNNDASYTVSAWFSLSLVEGFLPSFVVLLLSLLSSQITTVRSTNASRAYPGQLRRVTPAHTGLAPSRLISYLRYGKDAYAGQTQSIKK